MVLLKIIILEERNEIDITEEQRRELRNEYVARYREKTERRGMRFFAPGSDDWMDWEESDYSMDIEEEVIRLRAELKQIDTTTREGKVK